MRQHRGKTKDGKWVYGWYVEAKTCSVIIPQNCHVYEFLSDSYEVIAKTVGQSTGLCDKNGKETFAGDKLQDSTIGDIGVVYWKENIAGFYCKWGDGSDMPLNTGVAVNKCEIIGTIYDEESE